MLVYLVKSAACMAIFLLFYKLLLEKENMHVFKRFYLLSALVASLVIPSLVFVEYVEPIVVSTTITPTVATYTPMEVVEVAPPSDVDMINFSLLFAMLYGLGVLVFGFRFLKNLFQILNRIRKNTKLKVGFITKVLLQEKMTPHTFFKYIFLNKSKFEANTIPKEVILHEETHAKQRHSLDVLFVELLQMVLWFNPLIYFFKKSIKLNHEFLADQAVIKKDIDKAAYQNALLSYLSPDSEKKYQPQLANAINYSSIKKRFTIMKTHTSKKAVLFRSLLLLPLLAALIFGFSQKEILEIYPESNQEILGNWLNGKTENYALSIINQNGLLTLHWGETIIPIKKQGDHYLADFRGTDYPITINKETGVLKLWNEYYISESNSLRKKFEGEWENEKGDIKLNIQNFLDEFIWMVTKDGETNQFYPKKTNDGFHFSNANSLWSFEIQNDIISDSKGIIYKRVLKDFELEKATPNQVTEYNALARKYADSKKGETRIKVSEVEHLHKLYHLMTDEQKIKAEPFHKTLESIDSINRNRATAKEIKEYNALAKKYNAIDIEKRKIPLSDLKVLETAYRKMNVNQKENSLPFPECLPEKSQDGASRKLMAEYDVLAKKYNTMLSKSKSIQIKMKDVKRLEFIYSQMSDKQKADAESFPDFPEPPPTPKAPKAPKSAKDVKRVKGVKSVKGEVSNITPQHPPKAPKVLKGEVSDIPPPPAPPEPQSPLDHVIDMAKKGAAFYYEGKKVSSDKAIELLKENKDLNIQSTGRSSKNPTVKISKKPIYLDKSARPTPLETGNIEIDGEEGFYSIKNGVTSYFNSEGQHVDKNGTLLAKNSKKNPKIYYNGKKISSVKANRLLSSNKSIQVASKEYDNGSYAIVLNDLNSSFIQNVNRNNNPNSAIDLTEMIAKEALFFYNDKPITTEKALWLTQNNHIERVSTIESKKGKPKVYFWDRA